MKVTKRALEDIGFTSIINSEGKTIGVRHYGFNVAIYDNDIKTLTLKKLINDIINSAQHRAIAEQQRKFRQILGFTK